MSEEKGTVNNYNGVNIVNSETGDVKVGDVNVTVAEGSTPQETEFGKQLETFFKALDSFEDMTKEQKGVIKENLKGYKEATDKKDDRGQEIKKEALKAVISSVAKEVVTKLITLAAATPLIQQFFQNFVK